MAEVGVAQDRTAEISVEELRDQLDSLWEKHLTLLDRYHSAQQQLGRQFSSGFFDLAQATFKSPSRIRYGQDYYDDRAQATRRFISHLDDDEAPRHELKTGIESLTTDSTKDSEISSKEKVDDTALQQPTPPSTPPPELENERQSDEQSHHQDYDQHRPAEEHKENVVKKPLDPLHWFGILVPPQLRASQKAFVSAIEGPVIEAANSAQAIRHITLEIRKLRKDIKKAEKRSS